MQSSIERRLGLNKRELQFRASWSQDEVLALFLVIDALVPEWQKRTFGDAMASPFALLEEALRK